MKMSHLAGAPRGRILNILGAPIEDGASVAGAAMGPAMLRVAGLNRELAALLAADGFAAADAVVGIDVKEAA